MTGYYQKDWRSLAAEQEERASRLIWERGWRQEFPFGPNRLGIGMLRLLFSLSPRRGGLPICGRGRARLPSAFIYNLDSLPAANEQYTPLSFDSVPARRDEAIRPGRTMQDMTGPGTCCLVSPLGPAGRAGLGGRVWVRKEAQRRLGPWTTIAEPQDGDGCPKAWVFEKPCESVLRYGSESTGSGALYDGAKVVSWARLTIAAALPLEPPGVARKGMRIAAGGTRYSPCRDDDLPRVRGGGFFPTKNARYSSDNHSPALLGSDNNPPRVLGAGRAWPFATPSPPTTFLSRPSTARHMGGAG